MGVTAATVEEIQVGAGDVWYKDEDDVWQPVGATMEDNVWRVERDYTIPELNGVVSPLMGLDYLAEERVILETSLPEVSGEILALAIPGAVSTDETQAVVGGSTTTLASDTTAGQYLAIKLTAVTGYSVGDYIKIGAPGFKEIRQLTRVGTLGSGGTGVDVDFPLQATHSSGDAAVEVDGPGGTVIVGGPDRRLPSTAYHDWRLDVPGLDGRMTRFIVKNGIMTGNAEYAASDDDAMHPRLVIAGRRDAASPQDSAWEIRKEPAFS